MSVIPFLWRDGGNLTGAIDGAENVSMMWVEADGTLESEIADGDSQAYKLLIKINYSPANILSRYSELSSHGGYGYFTWISSSYPVALLTSRASKFYTWGSPPRESSNTLFLAGIVTLGTPSDSDAWYYKSGSDILMSIDANGNMTVSSFGSDIYATSLIWNSWDES